MDMWARNFALNKDIFHVDPSRLSCFSKCVQAIICSFQKKTVASIVPSQSLAKKNTTHSWYVIFISLNTRLYIYIFQVVWPWDFWTIKFRRIFSFKTQGCRFFPQASGLRRWPQGEARKIDEGLTPGTFNGNLVPSRKLTYPPPWEKENHLQNAIFGGIC